MLLQEQGHNHTQKPNSVPDLLGPFGNGSSSSSKSVIPFTKRIEFHPARKPYNGFVNGGGDFKIETLNPSGNSNPSFKSGSGDASVQNGKKVDGSEVLDGWLDPEFSFGASVQRIGAGLENLGNTCFLNSVLQCLTYTEPLAAYLQSGKHQISCRINGFCALCAIQKHVSRALKSTGRILAPKDLVVNLRCISRNFRNCRQEDAHEYMVNLLESMHKCCLPSGVPSESPGAYEKSLVHKIFGGRLRSQVKCMQCSYCSNKFDPFLDLSLEIAKAESVVKALRHFTAAEYLDGGEKQYNCQQCKQKVRALKQLTVHKAPYVLTVHLKRFHSHDPGQKINKSVQFDSTLDLKPFVSGNYEEDLKYTLYGVLVHHGWSTHSGHYYCYVRTSTNMWYSLDDNQVRQVSESTVLQQKAYMLFYVRNRNAAPRKPVNVARKECVKENVGGIRMPFTANQNSGPLPKSQVTNFGVGAASANTILRDALNDNSLIISREASLKENNPLAGAECRVRKDAECHVRKNTVMNSHSTVPSHKESLKESATLNPISSDSTLVNVKEHDIEHQVRRSSEYSEKGDPKKVLTVAASKLSNSYEISAAEDDKVSQKNAALSSSAILHTTSSSTPGEKTKRVFGTGRSGDENNSKSSQVAVEGASCAQLLGNSGQVALDGAAKPSCSLISSNGSTNIETQGSKPHKKVKKKILKTNIVTLHLSSNILFGSSLGPRKKHKKSKKLLKRVNSRVLDNDDMASDLGPSTSERTKQVSLVSSLPPKRKGLKNRASDVMAKKATNSSSDSLVNVNGELGERTANCPVLSADYPLEKNFGSNLAADQMEQMKEPQKTTDIRRESMQNGLMSMLTRGLEETIVAHWDGIELSPSPPPESNGVENTSIGYVLDEWDEEYDRGKRKKVKRSRHEFGGPNYFQQVASEKSKLKKTKLERASSGNQPFRI